MSRPDREDLSPHLVHLTRADTHHGDARDNLLSILDDGYIRAKSAYGEAISHFKYDEKYGDDFLGEVCETQEVVCFTETPRDELSTHVQPGRWGDFDFRPYGLVFPREHMMKEGANPVWYLNSTGKSGARFQWLARDVWNLVDEAACDEDGEPDPEKFNESEIARLTPFIERIIDFGEYKRDFSFEREWRYQGDFMLKWLELHGFVVPEGEAESFRQQLRDDLEFDERMLTEYEFWELEREWE